MAQAPLEVRRVSPCTNAAADRGALACTARLDLVASRGPRVSPLERDRNGGRRQDVRTGRALVLPLVALVASGVQPIVPGRQVVQSVYAAAPANARSNALG